MKSEFKENFTLSLVHLVEKIMEAKTAFKNTPILFFKKRKEKSLLRNRIKY